MADEMKDHLVAVADHERPAYAHLLRLGVIHRSSLRRASTSAAGRRSRASAQPIKSGS
jgi:hypothetical protein